MGPGPWHRAADTAVVAVGGGLGTLARYLLQVRVHGPGVLPWSTLAANLTGAFLLGLLLESLALPPGRPETHLRRRLRLGLGTGVIGGYTTYSAFAVQTSGLLTDGEVVVAVLYTVLSVLGGLLAAAAGVAVAARGRAGREAGEPVDPDADGPTGVDVSVGDDR